MTLNARIVGMSYTYQIQSYLTQKPKSSLELGYAKNVIEICRLSVEISIDKPAMLCYSIVNNRRVL
jgi:hypothetical protein